MMVQITYDEDETRLCFFSWFPTEVRAKIKKEDFSRLGKALCNLGTKKRRFTWKSEAITERDTFIFKVVGKKGPCLSFEYRIFNKELSAVSDCESFYDNISYEGVLQFGEQILSLENGKDAVLREFKTKA